MIPLPEYLLLIDTVGDEPGEWRFVLQVVGGEIELDITDVEPDARLADIRARIPRRSTARRWGLLAGGGALAVAATVTAIALASGPSPVTTEPDVANDPTGSAGSGETSAVAAYFVGETPTGDRLFREFQPVEGATPGVSGLGLLEAGPADPDYTSLWSDGSFEERITDSGSGVVNVYLTDAAPADPSELAMQQVVYTVRAGLQEQVKVAFHRGGERMDAYLQLSVEVHRRALRFRCVGSAAVLWTWLAGGQIQGMLLSHNNPYDVVAGHAVAAAAGAVVSDYAGTPLTLDAAGALAAVPGIHARLVTMASELAALAT